MQQPVEKTRCHPYPAAGPFVKKKNSYRPQRPARASEKATQDRKVSKYYPLILNNTVVPIASTNLWDHHAISMSVPAVNTEPADRILRN